MTDDVYAIKAPSWYGWLKLGHGDVPARLAAARTWRPDAVVVETWPGGGLEMEQWLHRELEAANYRRYKPRSEWFQVDLRAVQFAVSVGARNGVKLVAAAVAEQRRRAALRQHVTEREVQRQLALLARDAVQHQAQAARESVQLALRSSQPQYQARLPRLSPLIEK